jgi:hypothetical protein
MNAGGLLAWLRRNGPVVAIEVCANLLAPALIYALLSARWGEVPALIASSAPPVLWSLIGLLRHRRIDALSIIVLVGIALSLVAIGMAFIVSALIGRPLIGPLARATVARESAEALAEFDAHRDHGPLRHMIAVMTWVWGLGLLANFAVSVLLIYSLSVGQYLVIGPIVGYGTMGALAGWTVLYRRYRARLRERAGVS